MTGVQYYLRRDVPTTHGHVIHIDTEWALTSISQLQFWRSVAPAQFGDSDVRGILSVDVSDWTSPASNGRSAMHCSREDVVRETWRQLQQSINVESELLRDEDLHSWFLDPDIKDDTAHPGLLRNSEPLLVNLAGTWALRPEVTTALPNFFLASDYVRTFTDLATMEGANEAARRAVNGVLDAAGIDEPRCAVWPLHEPEAFAPWRVLDATRFKAGLPWDHSLVEVAAHSLRGASPMLERTRPLLERLAPFARGLAEVLDSSDAALEDASEVRTIDPTVAVGSAYVPTPQYAVLDVADAVPQSAALVGPGGFTERLMWYREMVADTLVSGIPTTEPQKHLYDLAREFLKRSGKRLRPALCIAAARALGGRAEDALPAAAGLEMLHNAFLVHDDIEDGSESRRGVPTMHRAVGVPIAVNTGDAMNALAARFFRRSGERVGPATAIRILEEVDHLVIETLEGQAIELGWVRDNDLSVGPDDYLRLVLKKTAWYSFIHPLRIGALIANGGDTNLARFDRFGYLLGLAFQITDDVLNLKGSVARYGKEIDGDLWEGKRTLVLTHALSRVDARDRAWMGEFLARPRERRLPRDVVRLHDLLDRTGSIAWAARSARAFADAAVFEFDSTAFAGVRSSADLEWLRSCVAFVANRDM
jgi:geranylgeranyl pyrophosphate synthase